MAFWPAGGSRYARRTVDTPYNSRRDIYQEAPQNRHPTCLTRSASSTRLPKTLSCLRGSPLGGLGPCLGRIPSTASPSDEGWNADRTRNTLKGVPPRAEDPAGVWRNTYLLLYYGESQPVKGEYVQATDRERSVTRAGISSSAAGERHGTHGTACVPLSCQDDFIVSLSMQCLRLPDRRIVLGNHFTKLFENGSAALKVIDINDHLHASHRC